MNNDDRGALFARQKKSAKAPDMGGDLTISRATVKYLVECIQAGKEAKLDLAAWSQVSKAGKKYLSLKAQPLDDDRFTKAARPADRGRTPSRQPFYGDIRGDDNYASKHFPDQDKTFPDKGLDDDIPPWE